MNQQQAIEILKAHNDYRRGGMTFEEFVKQSGASVADIGLAIDYAVNYMENKK